MLFAEFLSTTKSRRLRAALKTEGIVFPNMDRLRLVNNIFISSLKLNEILSKRTRMIQGFNNCKIFHKLNNFWTSNIEAMQIKERSFSETFSFA